MKRFFGLIFKLPLIILMIMVFMFIGISSAVAFSPQKTFTKQVVAPTKCLNHDSLNLFNYKNMDSSAYNTNLPRPTFHVGKIHRLLV